MEKLPSPAPPRTRRSVRVRLRSLARALLQALLSHLSRADLVTINWMVADELGLMSFAVRGELGTFEGSTHDRAVLARYLLSGVWDPGDLRLLVGRLFRERRGTLIDVGANIGLVCVPVVRATGVACVAFEPGPENFGYLRANAWRNGVGERLEVVPVALYSRNGTVDFELADQNPGDHRVRSVCGGGGETLLAEDRRPVIQVRATTLDHYLGGRELERPIVLKLDTQGSEVHVLEGGRQLLERVDCLIVEFAPYWLERMGSSVEDFIRAISVFPFGAIEPEAGEQTPSSLEPMGALISKLRAFANGRAPLAYTNLVLARTPSL